MPLALAILMCCSVALAAADPAAGDPRQLAQQMGAEFQAGKYAEAERTCSQLVALQPKDSGNVYNLACAQARQGKIEPALRSLARASELGFADADHALADDDLALLRKRPEFTKLIAAMRDQPYDDGSRYEPGAEVAGVKTIERAPAGGLRSRLRIGEQTTAAKPVRLVLWLHPSGGSGDQVVEPLATALAAHGYALAVFCQKQYAGWTSTELERIPASLADIGEQSGIDAKKPILMGFSAGGQAALLLWRKDPEAYGGLMTSAAYPIDQSQGQQLLEPPPAALAGRTPILALVGGADQGGAGERIWHQAEPSWSKAGVPLTLRVVPGRGHEFLFRGADWDACLAWLDARRGVVAAPAGAAASGGGTPLP